MVSLGLFTATCVVFLFFVFSQLFGRARADINCPFDTYILRASAELGTFDTEYTFDPWLANATHSDHENEGGPRWRMNRVVTGERYVECDWSVKAEDDDHTVSVTVVVVSGSPSSALKSGDCWTVFEGDESSRNLLGKVCEGKGTTEKTFHSSDRSLFLVFNQGARTGLRSLRFRYRSKAKPKTSVVKLAVVSSSVIAALGVCFLALKFTRCCRPCRKKWCPQCLTEMKDEEEEEEGANSVRQHELTHLTPSAPSGQAVEGSEDSLIAPRGTRTPSAPSDLGPNGFEPPATASEEEGCLDSPRVGGSVEGRLWGWHECEVGEGGRHGTHPPPAGTQASSPEPGRGSGGGGSDEGGGFPPPSGFAHPPPSYQAIFGATGETKI